MAEVDLTRIPQLSGLPRAEGVLAVDLYRLMTVFAASKPLAERRENDDDRLSVYGALMAEFEYTELSRLLISIAATVRRDIDADGSEHVGELATVEVGKLWPREGEPQHKPLALRESLNKIIHATAVNMDRTATVPMFAGHLEPVVHLYGEYRGAVWKASIDVFKWCEAIHSLV